MLRGKAHLVWLAVGMFVFFAAFLGCGGGDDGNPSPPPLVIDTAGPLPSGTVGTAYSQTFAASGGIPPYSWSVKSGMLPAGLTLSTGGILSGTPTTVVDNSSFTVQVSGGDNTTKSFSLTINAGPKMIGLEGSKQLVLLDNYDNTVRYRAAVRLLDAAGNALTDNTVLKGMKIYDPSGMALATDNNFIFWNGANFSIDNITAITPTPMSEIEMYLTAAPGTLSPGFYTASITDNTGNVYTSSLWFQTPAQVGEPVALSQVKNPDNSITLSWTNQTGPLPAPEYYLAINIVCNDTNGDGIDDLLLYAGRGNLQTFYTIPAAFVQSTLVGKTGLRWYVEIRQQTSSPVTFPDNTSSNPLIYRNRSVQVPLTL